MNPIRKALANLEMLEDVEGIEDHDEQLAVGLFTVAAAIEEGTVLGQYDDARVRYVNRDRSRYVDGEIEVYDNWVHVVDEEQWIPRDCVRNVEPN